MLFKNWLILNENIEQNFDTWAQSIQKYAKPHEKELLKSLGIYTPDERYPGRGDILVEFDKRLGHWKDIIIRVLKNKNAENLNWLAFSIGFLVVKTFRDEDLELAIDVTKRRIDNGELPKAEIGRKGWMQIGNEALEHVRNYLAAQQELSNRQKIKLKKSGETLEEDEELIKTIAEDDTFKLYYLPSLNIHPDSVEDGYESISGKKVEARKRLLCKYGKGTDWCTANPTGTYHLYYINNDIYILYENDKPKYQFTSCTDAPKAGASGRQFMDVKDNHVRDVTLAEKNFLSKHIKEAYICYYHSQKVIFPDIKSYLESSVGVRSRIALRNIPELVSDESFKNISNEEAADFFNYLSPMNLDPEIWGKILEHISEEHLNNSVNDHVLANIVKQISTVQPIVRNGTYSGGTYPMYEILNKKLSKSRFEKLLDLYKNDAYDYDKNNSDYIREKLYSRKTTIRNLLTSTHDFLGSIKILEFIVNKATIGKAEAYTIFDAMISKIYQENLPSTYITQYFDYFATAFDKENIDKIDLNRLKERMKIDLIPDGGMYKIRMNTEQSKHSVKNLMIRFLVKYHDKISDTDKAQD